MALIGLGLIAISFCFFAYTAARKQWPRYFSAPASIKTIDTGEKSRQNFNHASEHENLIPVALKSEDGGEPDSRPKETITTASVPLFNLHKAETDNTFPDLERSLTDRQAGRQSTTMSAPLLSTRPTSSMAPPPRPSTTSLMPPPSVKASALRPLPKLGGSLAPPPSAAATMRGAPKSASGDLSIPPSTSTLPPNKRPSRKVQLDPGHSPLDWANLIRNPPTSTYLRGDGIPPQLIKVTPSQLKKFNGRKGTDAWGTYQGKVYNLSPYLKFHPGGVGELMRGAGKVGEAERLFIEIHPWVNWDGMLSECLVGILVSEESIGLKQEDLESID